MPEKVGQAEGRKMEDSPKHSSQVTLLPRPSLPNPSLFSVLGWGPSHHLLQTLAPFSAQVPGKGEGRRRGGAWRRSLRP